MAGYGFDRIGNIVAGYFDQQEKKKLDEERRKKFGNFTAGVTDFLRRRENPQAPDVVPIDSLNDDAAQPDPFDLEAIRDNAPFPEMLGAQGQGAMGAPPAAAKPGQPGSNAFDLLGLSDIATMHQLSAENHTPDNAEVLKSIVDIWQGRDRARIGADNQAARLQGQMDMLDKRYGYIGGLEDKKHGYRMNEIDKRGGYAMKVADFRARAAERQVKLREARQQTDLQDMLDHYTDALADARADAQKIEEDVPISSNPDMARMGMDQEWTQAMTAWRQARAEAAREIRQIQGLIGQAWKGGAKMRDGAEPAPNAPPRQPSAAPRKGDPMGLY